MNMICCLMDMPDNLSGIFFAGNQYMWINRLPYSMLILVSN